MPDCDFKIMNNINNAINTIEINEPAPRASIEKIDIERGETEREVNKKVLEEIMTRIPQEKPIKALDLPCGDLQFLSYLKQVYPNANPTGADISIPEPVPGIQFIRMDLTREFELPREEQFDLITSISGVMMFSNTQTFIENCTARLRKSGTIIVSNDNSMTIMDRVRNMLFGRVRKFNPIYEDSEAMVQNLPAMELVRLLRINGVAIKNIEYTSFYKRDLAYLPLAILIYPLQYLYLLRMKSPLARELRWKMYPFRHLFCRHYFITGQKQ
jgi:trans-aconitate methyltransferase